MIKINTEEGDEVDEEDGKSPKQDDMSQKRSIENG